MTARALNERDTRWSVSAPLARDALGWVCALEALAALVDGELGFDDTDDDGVGDAAGDARALARFDALALECESVLVASTRAWTWVQWVDAFHDVASTRTRASRTLVCVLVRGLVASLPPAAPDETAGCRILVSMLEHTYPYAAAARLASALVRVGAIDSNDVVEMVTTFAPATPEKVDDQLAPFLHALPSALRLARDVCVYDARTTHLATAASARRGRLRVYSTSLDRVRFRFCQNPQGVLAGVLAVFKGGGWQCARDIDGGERGLDYGMRVYATGLRREADHRYVLERVLVRMKPSARADATRGCMSVYIGLQATQWSPLCFTTREPFFTYTTCITV